jgi:hypothetical protein
MDGMEPYRADRQTLLRALALRTILLHPDKYYLNMIDEDKSDKNYSHDVAVEAQNTPRGGPEYDAVFGEYKEGQVHYKSVGW